MNAETTARLSGVPSRSSTARRDVADVEVQRIAVEQQEERGDEQQDQQRAPVARDLPQLLAADGERLAHACARARSRSTTSRNTSSSDGATCVALTSTAMPAARSRSAISVRRDAGRAQDRVHRRAEQAGLLDLRHARRARAWRRPASAQRISTIGRPAKICFTSVVVPIAASRPAWIIATRWQRSASSR